MPRRRPQPLRAAAVLLLSAWLSAGCVGSPRGWTQPASVTPTPPAAERTAAVQTAAVQTAAVPAISAVVLTSNLWSGTSDLQLSVFDERNRALADTATPVGVRLETPDGALLPEQAAVIDQPTPGGRRLYTARVDLDQVGTWQLHIRAPDRGGLETTVSVEVLPDDGSPALGAPFPAVRTPTAVSAPGGLRSISSMPDPDPAFYERSVDELLARGEPFLLTIDSVGLRTTDTCGAGLGHLTHLHHELPFVRMVHAEPYLTNAEDGSLVLDPASGSPQPAPWAEALGAVDPPWVFVVDRDGRLWAKFHGIFGSDELRSAIETVTT
jgi:hypothetical protein